MIADAGLGEHPLLRVSPRILSGPEHAGFRLALACSRASRAPAGTALRRAVAEIVDWTGALQVVHRHRITGLAHQALGDLKADMPEAARRALAARASAEARNGLMLAGQAFRLADAFEAEGIPLAFLKGPVLSHQLYGDLGRRHSRDLDVIVAPEDRDEAAALLARLGYLPAGDLVVGVSDGWSGTLNEWEYRHPQSRTVVELHWRFCANAELAEPLARHATWGDVSVGGSRALRTLTGDTLAAYLCLHGSLHAWSRLKWLADLDALMALQGAEAAERLLAFAERAGLARPVAQGLALASSLLDTPLTPAIRRQLARAPATGRLGRIALAAMTAGKDGAELEESRFGSTRIRLSHFRLGRGWRYWRSQLGVAIASGEDRAAIRLPPALSPLYPILRPFLWALRRARRAPPARAGQTPHDGGSFRR